MGDRDKKGRFKKGHSQPGPGNPMLRKQRAFRKAIMGAATTKKIKAVMEMLYEKALARDLAAAREFLNRTCGKVSSAPATVTGDAIALPRLESSADLVEAADLIAEALADGRLDAGGAAPLVAAVELVRRTKETAEFEDRIACLESERAERENF